MKDFLHKLTIPTGARNQAIVVEDLYSEKPKLAQILTLLWGNW